MTIEELQDRIAELEEENSRLTQRINARRESVGTHSERCHEWHFECALAKLERAHKKIDQMTKPVSEIEMYIADEGRFLCIKFPGSVFPFCFNFLKANELAEKVSGILPKMIQSNT